MMMMLGCDRRKKIKICIRNLIIDFVENALRYLFIYFTTIWDRRRRQSRRPISIFRRIYCDTQSTNSLRR